MGLNEGQLEAQEGAGASGVQRVLNVVGACVAFADKVGDVIGDTLFGSKPDFTSTNIKGKIVEFIGERQD